MSFYTTCSLRDCHAHADVLVYSPGYPAPMIKACFEHLGEQLLADREAPYSMDTYELVVAHPDHQVSPPPWRNMT